MSVGAGGIVDVGVVEVGDDRLSSPFDEKLDHMLSAMSSKPSVAPVSAHSSSINVYTGAGVIVDAISVAVVSQPTTGEQVV